MLSIEPINFRVINGVFCIYFSYICIDADGWCDSWNSGELGHKIDSCRCGVLGILIFLAFAWSLIRFILKTFNGNYYEISDPPRTPTAHDYLLSHSFSASPH